MLPESVATLPPFGPIEGQKWFDRISSQWECQKNRFALIYFGKIRFLPPCIWNIPFVSYSLRAGRMGGGWGEPVSRTAKKRGFSCKFDPELFTKNAAWCSQTRCQSRRRAGQPAPPAAPLHSAHGRSSPARSPAKTRQNVVVEFISDGHNQSFLTR